MWFFVFGLPGEFAQWCDTVTAELTRRAFGSSELIHANSLEQFAVCAITTGAAGGVVSSRQPSGGLRTALVANGRNFVVAREDPRMALIDRETAQLTPVEQTGLVHLPHCDLLLSRTDPG